MANNLRHITNIVYKLKRLLGVSIILRQEASGSYDLETGAVSRTFTDVTIKRAVVLPSRQIRDFVYDLSFIAGNKNFTYGGMFDTQTRHVLIDAKDISVIPTLNDKIIYQNRMYMIVEIQEAEISRAYFIRIKEISNTDAVS